VWFVCVCLCSEDIDPSIGRFRNLVQTTVIPKKVRLWVLSFDSIRMIDCA